MGGVRAANFVRDVNLGGVITLAIFVTRVACFSFWTPIPIWEAPQYTKQKRPVRTLCKSDHFEAYIKYIQGTTNKSDPVISHMTVPPPKRRLLIRGPNIKTKRKPAKCAKKKVFAAVEMVKIAIMSRGSPGNDAFPAKKK